MAKLKTLGGRSVVHMSNPAFTFTTNAVGGTFDIWVPSAGFADVFEGSDNFTANAATGRITCNFTGKIFPDGGGSFSMSGGGSQEIVGEWFLDGVTTGYGFERTISSNSKGSFDSAGGAISVTAGQVLDFRIKSNLASKDIISKTLHVGVERLT